MSSNSRGFLPVFVVGRPDHCPTNWSGFPDQDGRPPHNQLSSRPQNASRGALRAVPAISLRRMCRHLARGGPLIGQSFIMQLNDFDDARCFVKMFGVSEEMGLGVNCAVVDPYCITMLAGIQYFPAR